MIDVLDVWLPAAGAELVNVNEGVLSIIGLVTSLMGISTQWKAVVGKN